MDTPKSRRVTPTALEPFFGEGGDEARAPNPWLYEDGQPIPYTKENYNLRNDMLQSLGLLATAAVGVADEAEATDYSMNGEDNVALDPDYDPDDDSMTDWEDALSSVPPARAPSRRLQGLLPDEGGRG